MHRFLRSFPRATVFGLIGALFSLIGAAACHKLPLLAPTGTVINLTVASDSAATNSSVQIIAVLIENGQQSASGTGTGTSATNSSTAGAGTPVQDGTVVSFTSSIGSIDPAEAKTVNGKVTVTLNTGSTSGTATITAYSGGAKSTAQIKIGTANAKTVTVTATPQNLTANGGTATISARVDDANGNGVSGAAVQFTSTKGSLSPTTATTNGSGVATTTLTTTAAADVTATVAGLSGKVSVGVSTKATIAVSGPSSSVAISAPATFSIVVGTAVSVSNVVINYGDGSSKALGALSGTQSVTHYYAQAGIFDVSVAATDPDGVVTSAGTQVAITSLAGTVAANPTTITRGAPVTYTATVTPTAAVIDHYTWDFGDGTTATSVGNVQSHTYATTLAPGTYTVAVRAYPLYGDAITMPLAMQIAAQKGSISITAPNNTAGTTFISTATGFTIDVGTAVAMTNISIDYGDGSSRSLGNYSGSRSDTKFYSTPSASGAYTVRASGTDPDGNVQSASLQMFVQKLSGTLAITTAGSSTTPTVLTLTLGTGQSNALIDHYAWDFGDGSASSFADSATGVSPTHQYSRGVWLAKVTVYPSYGAAFVVTISVPIS